MWACLEGDLGARLIRHESADIEEDDSCAGDRDLEDHACVCTETRLGIYEDVVVKRGSNGFAGFRVDERIRAAHRFLHLDQISVLVKELSQGVIQNVLVENREALALGEPIGALL